MDVPADTLVSRAAREVSSRVDELIHDVQRSLRRGVPEVWEDPDVARMTAENVTEHVLAALAGLVDAVEPGQIRTPVADPDRARRLAQHGTPVNALLRAFRLAQGVILDRLLEEMPRLTDDAALISAATRKLIVTMTEYIDRMSEQGVAVYQAERDRRLQWRLSVVNEAGLRIGTVLDIDRTAQELADLGTETFADLVTVDLLDSVLRGHVPPAAGPLLLRRVAQRTVVGGAPSSTIRLQQLHVSPDGSPQARALINGEPSRLAEPAGTPRDVDGGGGAGEHRVQSTLVVPLRARDCILGVAEFGRCRNPRLFDDEDLLLAQEIAARAAVAIDNARRYTHARSTALTLQRSLLPQHTAEQSAVEIAYRYLPAEAQAGVGGDWYDVIPLSGARVALVVGDVVGHGIHAAATMGRLRTAVRTLADIDLPPDELLTHLDDVVLRLSAEASPDGEPAGDIGATCLYAVYDPVSRQCTVARAGHVLPVVVSRDGTTDLLDVPPGPPLGLGGLPFEAADFVLPEGSLLALYTDGLIEARDHDVETGVALLRHTLGQPSASLQAACDTVLQALLPPDRPSDDVALLLARTHALGARQVASWDVDPDPVSVSRARSDVARQLISWGLESLEFTTELMVSELVTNAIRYGRPPIRLRLIHDRALMCEVSDTSNTTPHMRRARTYDEGGRGLLLIAQLAAHWGTRHARQGKTVWAELSEKEPAGPVLGDLL
ncbi:SpoIIE family protein phosphatase [Streptomyces sp. NPDC002250]|uniref:ATP-binding SpoIIE family protein phosphatase n=1 Tax=Streptomyces sp. NPDC002250 TaxID=3364641 RepID=UPI00367C6F76